MRVNVTFACHPGSMLLVASRRKSGDWVWRINMSIFRLTASGRSRSSKPHPKQVGLPG